MQTLETRFRCVFRFSVFLLVCLCAVPFSCAFGLFGRLIRRLSCEWLEAPLTRLRGHALQICCRCILSLCNIRVERVEGTDRVSSEAPEDRPSRPSRRRKETRLVLSNHVSYLDVVVLGSMFPSSFVAKEQIRSWPLVGFLCQGLGCIFVDRVSLSARVQALFRIEHLLGQGSVCVFPEGTTTKGCSPSKEKWHRGQVWSALSGRRHTAGVTAVGLHYADQHELAWVDDMAFLPHLFKVFSRQEIRVFVSSRHVDDLLVDGRSVSDLSDLVFKEVTQLCQRSALSARLAQIDSSLEVKFDDKETYVTK